MHDFWCQWIWTCAHGGHAGGAVPEIHPGSFLLAVAVCVGVLAILTGRRAR